MLCTVAAIDADMGWFYWTCKVCSKEVWSVPKYKDDVLEQCCYCATCNTYNPKTDTRYGIFLFFHYFAIHVEKFRPLTTVYNVGIGCIWLCLITQPTLSLCCLIIMLLNYSINHCYMLVDHPINRRL